MSENYKLTIMKELSIEEKAKVYDGNYKAYTELINRLEGVKDAIKKQNYGIAMDILCKPYPEHQIITSIELKESEDERIRKEIIYHIQYCDDTIDEVAEKRMIAWLEKQGEQKPVDNGESNLLTVERAKEMSPFMMSSFENESAAWSEEDEDKFNQICSCVEAAPSDVCYYSRETLENWLKSLRPQNTWKPSDEQINALAKNVEYVNVGCTQSILKALLEDLKKLRDE